MPRRILVADDEPDTLEPIVYVLEGEGFEVDCVADGEAALAAALARSYDVVLLDVIMPRLSGTEVCRRLRARSAVPIIMLTARDGELDRILGLEVGADDYVTKPFSSAELTSRIRAVLRRQEFERAAEGASIRELGGLRIDRARHTAEVDGQSVELTRSEFALLGLLASRPGHVFTRRQLMEQLWEQRYAGDERACDVHISNLRQKLERDPARPERILTVRGAGYKLVAA